MTTRTQAEKLWLVGAAVAALLLFVIGWFMLISPQRHQTSEVDGQTATVQLANDTLQSRIVTMRAQNAKLATYHHALEAAQAALPDHSDTSTFLRSMQSIAHASQTTLTSVTINPAQPWTPPAAAGTAPTTTPSSSTTSPATSSATTTGTAGAASGVYEIPVTAAVTGSPTQLATFLAQLQQVQPRAVLITQMTRGDQAAQTTSTQQPTGRTTLTLTMTMFAMPSTSGAAPAPAATPASGSGG